MIETIQSSRIHQRYGRRISEAHPSWNAVGSPDGTLDAIRISPVSHHRDAVADIELGHIGSEALDMTNAFTPDHELVLRHKTHRSRNILRTEDTF